MKKSGQLMIVLGILVAFSSVFVGLGSLTVGEMRIDLALCVILPLAITGVGLLESGARLYTR